MKLSDAIFGLLLLALGAVVIAVVSSYPTIPAQRVGPALFPALIALGLVIGGLILIVRGWRDRATVPWIRFEPWVQSPRHVAGFIGVIGSVVFYIVAVRLARLPADVADHPHGAVSPVRRCARPLDRDRGDCHVRHPLRFLQVAARATAVGRAD